MRILKSIYIHCIILSFVSISFLYLFLTTDFFLGAFENSSSTSCNHNFLRTRNINEVPINEAHISRINSSPIVQNEVSYVWRSLSKIDSSQDKVIDLIQWFGKYTRSKEFRQTTPKHILVFNGLDNYYGTSGRLNCPFNEEILKKKCIIKEDRLLEISNHLVYDAYVGVRNWKHVLYDQKIPWAKHIYYIQESPFVAKYADLSINNAILASYWRGSDIVLPYGHYEKFGGSPPHKNEFKRRRNYAKGKTKLAAIVVSNCEAINDRLSYVTKLSKFIRVDIYGACGTHRCDKSCFELVKKEYKFYLAFEKANCRDYITEKFWNNALKHDTIPVVMGAHPDDYKDTAPPHSYIHVEDFKSPKELADYLMKINANDTLYNEYFEWKRSGRVRNVWSEFFCRVCGMLFYVDIHPPPSWPDKTTWKEVNRCLPYNKWYWTRGGC